MGDFIRPAAVLLIICTVIGGALAATYSATKDIIAEGQAGKADDAKAEVLGLADSFVAVDEDEVAALVNAGSYPMVTEVYEGLSEDGSSVGYVATAVTKGYGGDILVLVGVGADMVISGVRIISHTETAGLGGNATKPAFYTQYDNKSAETTLRAVKGETSKANEISAISGATITSRAVTEAVNEAAYVIGELMR